MIKTQNKNGYTLLELLLITGLVSLASIGLYSAYLWTDNVRKTKSEVQSLSNVIRDLENYNSAKGDLLGINLNTLHSYSQNFQSSLNLTNISSTTEQVKFFYSDINSRICNDFTSKILSSNRNISSKINNNNVQNDLSAISTACNQNNNDIEITYNKAINTSPITVVTASVNAPPLPAPDIIVPDTPTPLPTPQVAKFVPPSTIPVTYGITGTAPVYPIVPPSGAPISVTPGGNGGGNVSQPGWTPPGYIAAPPAVGAPVDDIDQDPLPPIITTENRTLSCPTGYTGSITETRKKTYYQGSGNVTYSNWTQTSNTCIEIPSNQETHTFTEVCRGINSVSWQGMSIDKLGCYSTNITINITFDPTHIPTNPPSAVYSLIGTYNDINNVIPFQAPCYSTISMLFYSNGFSYSLPAQRLYPSNQNSTNEAWKMLGKHSLGFGGGAYEQTPGRLVMEFFCFNDQAYPPV